MIKHASWVIAIVLFVWAAVSAFSIFSELKFLVDGWTWSVDQVPISIKAVALAVGKYVSGIVGGYHGFVHGLVQMLQLTHLPSSLYDALGVVSFSVGRGYWPDRRAVKVWTGHSPEVFGNDGEVPEQWVSEFDSCTRSHPLFSAKLSVIASLWGFVLPEPSDFVSDRWRWLERAFEPWLGRAFELSFEFIANVLVYGGFVAIVIAALFGIDHLYRHFA